MYTVMYYICTTTKNLVCAQFAFTFASKSQVDPPKGLGDRPIALTLQLESEA